MQVASSGRQRTPIGFRSSYYSLRDDVFSVCCSGIVGHVYYPFLTNKGFTGVQATSITANMYLGAIISTLFAGYLADRWINSEGDGYLPLSGAGLLLRDEPAHEPGSVLCIVCRLFYYSLVFIPTLSVINSLTFRNVPDGERDFPGLRVLGTIGWICAGFLADFLFHGKVEGIDGKLIPNYYCHQRAIDSSRSHLCAIGIYCLVASLRHHPQDQVLELSTFSEPSRCSKDFSFFVFFVITLIASIAMGMYFNSAGDYLDKGAGITKVPSTLAIGQMVELALLVLLPLF